MTKQKIESFKNDTEREVAVVIAIQKIGIATIPEIIKKVSNWGGKLTDKQTHKSVSNLQARGILSVDMGLKKDGITQTRYKIKRLTYSVPEIPQIKSFVDSEESQPLIDELEKTKKGRKKGFITNYYEVDIEFEVLDGILGFIPAQNNVGTDRKLVHYRQGKDIVLLPKHFRKWLAKNMRLINRYPTVAKNIQSEVGIVNLNGNKLGEHEQYVVSVDGGFRSSGRGSTKYEVIPAGAKITTSFLVPEDEFEPEEFKKVLERIGRTPLFGLTAYSSSGTYGRLKLTKYEVGGLIWDG